MKLYITLLSFFGGEVPANVLTWYYILLINNNIKVPIPTLKTIRCVYTWLVIVYIIYKKLYIILYKPLFSSLSFFPSVLCCKSNAFTCCLLIFAEGSRSFLYNITIYIYSPLPPRTAFIQLIELPLFRSQSFHTIRRPTMNNTNFINTYVDIVAIKTTSLYLEEWFCC